VDRNTVSAVSWFALTQLLCRAMGVLGLLSGIGPVLAQSSCYIPTNLGQSVSAALTDSHTGLPLFDGAVVPNSGWTLVTFHQTSTAYGYCTVYGPDPTCPYYINTYNRDVNHITTGLNAHSSSLNGTYSLGNVWGKNPNGTSAFYQSLDDSDTTHTTGPIAPLAITAPGTYTFTTTNITDQTICPILPATVATTLTVTYYDATSDKTLGRCQNENDGQSNVGNPCNAATGNKYQQEVDYQSTTLPVVRHYNSKMFMNVGLGYGWITPYHRRLEIFGASLRIRRGDGRSEPWNLVGGVWTGDADTKSILTQNSGGFSVIAENGDTEQYNSNGVLQTVQSPGGKVWSWSYDATTHLLSGVTDNFGHALQFQYTGGLLQAIVLPDGNRIQYAYDSNQNLISATYADGAQRQYIYENTSNGTVNQLTGIADESGTRYATYTYNSNNQVTSSQHAGGADLVTLSYSYGSTGVTDAYSVARTYTYQTILSANKVTSISGTSCPSCGGAKSVTYDTQGNPLSRTDFNGNQTKFS
jgi:YD repeat-containing protein